MHAHVLYRSPVNCLKILNQNLIATGDDDGGIKVIWQYFVEKYNDNFDVSSEDPSSEKLVV